MINQISIATTSEVVKEFLHELEEHQIIVYNTDEDNSEVVVAEHLNEVGTPTEEMVFQVRLVAEQKTVYSPGKYLAAFIDRLAKFKEGNKEYIIGERDDFLMITSGRLISYVKETLTEQEEENEITAFEAKIKGIKESGRGMFFANSASLVRSHKYCMVLEEKYPNMLFLLCGSNPSEGEEEYIEAFMFH
ncbi:MAG: hypothetical protein Q4G58_11280 [bacterium]|nr:hypothetical protein [bacterium]